MLVHAWGSEIQVFQLWQLYAHGHMGKLLILGISRCKAFKLGKVPIGHLLMQLLILAASQQRYLTLLNICKFYMLLGSKRIKSHSIQTHSVLPSIE